MSADLVAGTNAWENIPVLACCACFPRVHGVTYDSPLVVACVAAVQEVIRVAFKQLFDGLSRQEAAYSQLQQQIQVVHQH
jgi:hypothetical protein